MKVIYVKTSKNKITSIFSISLRTNLLGTTCLEYKSANKTKTLYIDSLVKNMYVRTLKIYLKRIVMLDVRYLCGNSVYTEYYQSFSFREFYISISLQNIFSTFNALLGTSNFINLKFGRA